MGNSDLLFESLFKRKLTDAGTLDYLTQITNEHPYFSPAHFFLLLQAEKGTTAYQQQAAKTSVLFNNPYWLQFQLQENEHSPGELSDTIFGDKNQSAIPENQDVLAAAIKPNETRDNGGQTILNHPVKAGSIEEIQAVSTNQQVPAPQPEEAAIGVIADEALAPAIQETVQFHSEEITPEVISASAAPYTGGHIISDNENNADGIIAEKKIEPALNEWPNLSQPEKKIITEKEINEDNNESAFSIVPENEDEINGSLPSGHFNNEKSPLVNETETEDEPITEPEIEPLNYKLNIDTANTTEDTITFEPLHTSDYFASLGIKLSGEIQPSDKLGKQLKSFTDWLKTMKKINGDLLPPQIGQPDISIQRLAEQSNKEAAVVTEAMAEVLLLQGKDDKAIEVYNKLSLLNPSKSAYFAAKIDQLKEH